MGDNVGWDKRSWLRIGLAVALFSLALIPRFWGLGVTVTTDEPGWVARSARFASALLSGNLADTYLTSHPGVTTMWTGAAGLLAAHLFQDRSSMGSLSDFLAAVSTDPFQAPLFPAARFLTALLTSACVVAVYFLVGKLFDHETALLSAIILALDPFYLAHSRVIHHDALVTTFMTLSILCLAVYLGRRGGRLYLILSGLALGLAFLSKASALFLAPFLGLSLLAAGMGRALSRREWEEIKRAVFALVLWGLCAALAFIVIWPTMWVRPVGTLQRMLGDSAELAGGGHLQFFRGQITLDAGPWFYPFVFLFRTTPLSLLGFGTALLLLGVKAKGGRWLMGFFLTYGALFTAFLSLLPKKQDRYLLPVFPVVDILAAVGWIEFTRLMGAWLWSRSGRSLKKVGYGLTTACLILQAAFVIPYHPYCLGFYNPIMGGPQAALETLRVGWGDGLDQAGRYLSGKEDASQLTVAAVPAQCLAPFFPGEAVNLYTNATALSADYAVLYVNQVQRQAPSPDLVRYFRSRKPEHVVRLSGIEYAWVYQGPKYLSHEPQPVQWPVQHNFSQEIALRGYDLEALAVEAGGEVRVVLHWERLAEMKGNYSAYVRLVDEAGHVWGGRDGPPVIGLLPTTAWPAGAFVRDERAFKIAPVTPPGEYRLKVGLYAAESGLALEVLDPSGAPQGTAVTLGPVSIVRPSTPPSPAEVAIERPLRVDMGHEVRLLGYDGSAESARPGDRLSVALYWQALRDVKGDYGVHLYLKDGAGRVWSEEVTRPVGGTYPTVRWKKADIWRDWHDLLITADTPAGEYQLWVGLLERATGDAVGEISLGPLAIQGRPRRFEAPPIGQPLQARLGQVVEFLGYDLEAADLKPGGSLPLTLYWRALAEIETSYTVFVHLLDENDRIWGQRDSMPGGGDLPTTGWVEGEVIVDGYEVLVAPDAPVGVYRIEIGMYDATTGERLTVHDEGGAARGDRILLPAVTIRNTNLTDERHE